MDRLSQLLARDQCVISVEVLLYPVVLGLHLQGGNLVGRQGLWGVRVGLQFQFGLRLMAPNEGIGVFFESLVNSLHPAAGQFEVVDLGQQVVDVGQVLADLPPGATQRFLN